MSPLIVPVPLVGKPLVEVTEILVSPALIGEVKSVLIVIVPKPSPYAAATPSKGAPRISIFFIASPNLL